MSRHYKEIKNGKGTHLIIGADNCSAGGSYISVGPGGTDIMLRGAGKVYGFDTWDQLILSIDEKKADYVSKDMEVTEN